MGCAGWVGSQIRQHDPETVPDTGENSQCSSFQQTFRIATQTAIGRTGGVHTSVLAVNEHSL